MNIEYQLEKMSLHTESRVNLCKIIAEDKSLPLLIQIMQRSSEYRLKAIVALEFYARDHWKEAMNYSEEIIEISTKINSETEKRCISKLLAKIAEYQYKNSDFKLPKSSLEKVVNVCFDWLLIGSKTATISFAMQCLYFLGFKFEWIHPELKEYIQRNISQQSAGFKSRGTKILKKLR